MNYGSGLMLGMGLVQAAKGLFGASSAMGGMGGMGGSMRGKTNPMESVLGMLGSGENRGGMGRGKKTPANFSDFSSFQMPSAQTAPAPSKPSFELVSALPGRRRYRASAISKELAVIMEENLSKLDYVQTIRVNADTGSVLITFEESDLDKIDEIAHWIKKHLFSENYAEYKRDRKLNQIFYGSITKSVKSTLRHISHILIRETHGLFDIRSLSSAIFAIFGFRKVILNGEFPSGIQMLWWAVSLMRGTKGV